MNKFLQYINETLVSLDIPAIINVEDTNNFRGLKKQPKKTKNKQQK